MVGESRSVKRRRVVKSVARVQEVQEASPSGTSVRKRSGTIRATRAEAVRVEW